MYLAREAISKRLGVVVAVESIAGEEEISGAGLFRQGDDLIEHELDHVFIGHTSDQPTHDPAEVDEWRWVNAAEVREWVTTEPTAFTAWFGLAFEGLMREADKSLDILLYSYILQLGRTAQ